MGINILQALLIFVTVGIGAPWAICMKQRWIAGHTYIDGHQLAFDGTGSQLIGKYILWLLLTVVTLGIYSFWLEIKLKQWLVSHTHMI